MIKKWERPMLTVLLRDVKGQERILLAYCKSGSKEGLSGALSDAGGCGDKRTYYPTVPDCIACYTPSAS
jgi:hypothetical protein